MKGEFLYVYVFFNYFFGADKFKMDQNGTRLENFSIVYAFELFGGCKIQNGTRVEFVQIVLVFELFGAKR